MCSLKPMTKKPPFKVDSKNETAQRLNWEPQKKTQVVQIKYRKHVWGQPLKVSFLVEIVHIMACYCRKPL